MAESNLKNKAVRGIAWNAFEKVGVYSISFIIGVILARILMPADYGLIGMLTIFFAFSELFVRSGFSEALIQKKERTDVDYSTVFYFNVVVAIIFYLILFLSAPWIAKFYNAPKLVSLTRVLSLNIVINSLALVPQTRLTINLDFKSQAKISFISVILSGPAGIIAAYNGFGVWALVIQNILNYLIRAVLLFYFNNWKPLFVFNYSVFRQLFGFSSKLLGAGIIATIFNNIYTLIIGKVLSAKDLGYYTRARQYPELLSNTISNVLKGVTFPILSSLQEERERMVYVYGKIMRIVVFFVIPALTLLALISEPFIRLLLTEKWLPAVSLLQWLCFARIVTPISALNMNILNAIGRSDLFLRVDLSKIPIALTALIITVPMGLEAIVIGHFITTLINFFINTYYPGKLFGFGAVRQLREMAKVIIATIGMALVVYGVMTLLQKDIVKLLVSIPLAVIIYLSVCYFLKMSELQEVFEMLKSIKEKNSIK